MKIDEIYQGDAYELIKQVEDKSIDLVIIDPPYEFVAGGTGQSEIAKRKLNQKVAIYNLDTDMTKSRLSGGGCFGTKHRDYYKEIANNHFVSKGFTNEILDELCRVMKKINIYIFCSKRQLRQIIDYFDDKGCFYDLLVWAKTNPLPCCNNTYLSDLEYCIFAREKGVELLGNVKTKSKFYISPLNVADKKDYEHPTIKPLELIKNLIINSSREGGVVLDCFLGSGTTCVGAKELNRHYIGFELDPHFYQIAKDRLNGINQKGEMNLFETDFDELQEQYDLLKGN